jgi:hypothetical protein
VWMPSYWVCSPPGEVSIREFDMVGRLVYVC